MCAPFEEKFMMLCGYKNPAYAAYWKFPHFGLDVSTIQGNASPKHNVIAGAEGVVLRKGWDNSYGNCVVIIYFDVWVPKLQRAVDLIGRYAHLKTISVYEGQHVKFGDVLGIEGNTKTGDHHLHLEFDTDCRYFNYSPQVSSADDHKKPEEGNIIIQGYRDNRDSTINPSEIMYLAPGQELVKPTYNPAWLNASDLKLPSLPSTIDYKEVIVSIHKQLEEVLT